MMLNNKGESREEEIFGLVALFALFILYRYWIYILIALSIFVLYKIIVWIHDKDLFSKFKENKLYCQGENGKQKLKELEQTNHQYQINCYKKGLYGESRILYTLSNIDHMPMYILYDVALEYKNKKAQIDFIVVTKKWIYVLETKNLTGNIDIESDGTFTRKIGRMKRGIKNPLTQSKEHEKVLKTIFKKEKIYSKFSSLVVLANDENYVHFKKNAGIYKKSIIRNDKLEEELKIREKRKHIVRQEEKMKKICDSILKYTKVNTVDTNKIIEALKNYRTRVSFQENIPAYLVYNDSTIEELVNKLPKTLEELRGISGLGDYKVEKYGEDILKIISGEYR